MAYIAARPVHFDREYKIGEIIPPEAIDPAMSRKLIEMGKIIEVSLPEPKKLGPAPTGEESPETTPDAAESAKDTSTSEADEPRAERQGSTPDTAPKPGTSRKTKTNKSA